MLCITVFESVIRINPQSNDRKAPGRLGRGQEKHGGRLGYGIADYGISLAFNLPGLFLLFFFTDIFLIPSAAAG